MHHRTTFGCMLYIIIRSKRLFVDNGQRFRCCVRIIFPTAVLVYRSNFDFSSDTAIVFSRTGATSRS